MGSFTLFEVPFHAPAFSQEPLSDLGWQAFERQVRDGEISFQEGQKAIAAWAKRLEREFPRAHSEMNLFSLLKSSRFSSSLQRRALSGLQASASARRAIVHFIKRIFSDKILDIRRSLK
jgi:hypothetical protein